MLRRSWNRSRSIETVPAPEEGKVILAGLDLDIQLGEVVTLIVESEWAARLVPRVLIGLESSNGGEVELQGTRLSGLSEHKKLQLRRDIGYLFRAEHEEDIIEITSFIHEL